MDALRFAVTKIQPPRLRSARVERASLRQALGAALSQRRVVLLLAPAGFGKTCALAGQVEALGPDTALAWVSLDEDDDPQRLLACLIAALEPHDLPWRTAPEALLGQLGESQGEGGMRRVVVELVNTLAATDVARGVIVLDDLHRVQAPAVPVMLDALIERLPAHWTLVLSTRVEPQLALARLRVADELAEFGPEELRFSADEASALARLDDGAAAPGTPAPAAQIATLYERTRGWPAGLRLSLAALRARPGGAASRGALIDHRLFDYLAGEVLDDMPQALHDFLLRCSVLPVLTSARCAAVSGDPRAAELLDEVERRGLFVTALDAQERTLVLHDLFRDALGDRLHKRFGADVPALLQRAAAGEADPLRRVGYLLRAADPAAAESVLAAAAESLLLQGGVAELRRAVEQFPREWSDASARLQRLRMTCLAQGWHWDDVAQRAEVAAATARAAGDEAEWQLAQTFLAAAWHAMGRHLKCIELLDELRPQPLHPQARAMFLVSECSMIFRSGRHDALPAAYGELLAELERSDSLFTWWACAPANAWMSVRGMRALMQRYGRAALLRVGEREITMRADLHMLQAWDRLWAGEVDVALAEAAATASDSRWLACSASTEGNLLVFHATVDAIRGRAEPVRQMLEAWLARAAGLDATSARAWRHDIAAFAVRVHDVLGSGPVELERWSQHFVDGVPVPDTLETEAARTSVFAARFAAAQGRWQDASALFLRVLPRGTSMDSLGQANELCLRAAHALLQCGQRDAAAATLAPGLARIRAEGERGHALMCGTQVLSALACADWSGRLDPALQQELQAIVALAAGLRDAAPDGLAVPSTDNRAAPAVAAGAGLSSREREVLERIASGDSNKLIARGLDISPHTVKRHVCNILDKLALSSRGQAAAWLREHA